MSLEVTKKRGASNPVDDDKVFKKPKNIESIEERVNSLYNKIMGCYFENKFVIGHFDQGKLIYDGYLDNNQSKILDRWKKNIFYLIKQNSNQLKIWELVFKKLPIPLITIPFGYEISYTLPSYLWEYHSKGLENLPDTSADVSPENIQKFNQCLQKCSSHEILSKENWQVIMKLAKRYSIQWLFTECLFFGLNRRLAKELASVAWQEWQEFYARNTSCNPCRLKFKEFQHFLIHLFSKSFEMTTHLNEIIPLFYSSEKDNKEHTINFNQKLEIKLPLYLWKAHSNYNWLKEMNLQDDIPKTSLTAFGLCLTRFTSYKILNLENYKDLLKLAGKYQILWLLKDCEEFFKVHALSKAANAGFIHTIKKDMLEPLIQNKTPLSLNAKEALNKLADLHQLLSLKLFVNGFFLKILSDGIVFIEVPEKNPTALTLLQTCLAMEKPWDAPKIELNCTENHFSSDDVNTISKIIETTKCPISVSINYYDPKSEKRNQLSELLKKYSQLKHLKIILNGTFEDPLGPVLKMIKENTTLESLGLVINENGGNYWDDKNVEEGDTGKIKKALEENGKIKEMSLLYSKYQLNRTRSFIKKDGALLKKYDFSLSQDLTSI